jgi:hypothetical protein
VVAGREQLPRDKGGCGAGRPFHQQKVTGSRDDKKERVVERERTVAKGGGCRRGGDAFPVTIAHFKKQLFRDLLSG